jgi:hypothetical protein
MPSQRIIDILKEVPTSIDWSATLDPEVIKAGLFQQVRTQKGADLIIHIAIFLRALTSALQNEHAKTLNGQPADSGWDVLFTQDCSSNRKADAQEKVLEQMSSDDGTEVGQMAAVDARIVSYGLGRSSRETGGGNDSSDGRVGVWAYKIGDTPLVELAAGNYDFDYDRHVGRGPRDTVSGLAHRENRVYETWYERKSQAGSFGRSQYHQKQEADYWGDIMNARIYGSSKKT